MQRGKRHTDLIANFINGYADGWHMAVKECFRNELDIKYTERKKDKQSYFEWTQGPYYSFAKGHLFYDNAAGYEKWDKALGIINICCKIISAIPTALNKDKNIVEGTVVFTLYQSDKKHKILQAVKDYELSQTEFVKFLRTGVLDETAHYQSR